MSWWGKGVGAAAGFALGGPLGAMIGGVIGHQVDKKKDQYDTRQARLSDQQSTTQAAFFTATFAVMGHVAKADGRVSEREIAMARNVMQHMQLNAEQQHVAIELFNRGKSPDFDLDAVLEQFKQVVHRRSSLIQMFLEIQITAALADGMVDGAEQVVLLHICQSLGISQLKFQLLLARMAAVMGMQGSFGGGQQHRGHAGGGWSQAGETPQSRLKQAYAVLELPESATDDEVKRAYRKLMSQNHPDKLVSKGLPEEMIQLATEKTQQIKLAYETIREARA
ncbi:co-chaperone DjlA [Acidihalobacter ferrooxydans]|uniref:Co-chaperone protein DjlA n=1 Tax=Acidihalobacter ferrooxydans TaxID=1765967 RepID=A0A1P8UHF1_9GAMM|nr:co-chaperone DjlA [Acidihalobacter ferrooxydans]APZ43278.1 molecular chaperone DjlA [Acidihalobacter ferrooxydans]